MVRDSWIVDLSQSRPLGMQVIAQTDNAHTTEHVQREFGAIDSGEHGAFRLQYSNMLFIKPDVITAPGTSQTRPVGNMPEKSAPFHSTYHLFDQSR